MLEVKWLSLIQAKTLCILGVRCVAVVYFLTTEHTEKHSEIKSCEESIQ